MRSILHKKGQVNTIGPAIIALMIAGVFLILGLVILQEVRDSDIVTIVNTATTNSEAVATVTEAGDNLAAATGTLSPVCSINAATNATGTFISSGNYTVTNCNLAFRGGDTQWNNTNWVVNYTYTSGDEAYSAGNSTLFGVGTFADFWEIIVLAVIIAVVIGLLLVVFGGRRSR